MRNMTKQCKGVLWAKAMFTYGLFLALTSAFNMMALGPAVAGEAPDEAPVKAENFSDDSEAFTADNIYRAIEKDNVDEVRRRLQRGANPDIRMYYDSSPLDVAVFTNKAEIARVLLENGADVNRQDINGYTPLMWAARNGSVDAAKVLIENGADVHAVSQGAAELLCGGLWGAWDVQMELGQMQAMQCGGGNYAPAGDPYENVRTQYVLDVAEKCAAGQYYDAARESVSDADTYTIRRVLEMLDFQDGIKDLEQRGVDLSGNWAASCPLYDNILTGSGEKVLYTVELSLYNDVARDAGYTPLHWAAGSGHGAMVEYLLSEGAQADAATASGATPLDLARAGNYQDVIALLQANNAASSE